MMKKMMNSMIEGMPVKEREEMMLKMMPMMMKKINPKICAKNMAETLGSEISLYALINFIIKAINEDEIKEGVKNKFSGMKDKMPDMMSIMMPFMKKFMSGMMPKMMSFMMPMMSEMMGGKGMDGCSMKDKMLEDPEMKEKMSKCMRNMCPSCTETMYPAIPDEERKEFALQMIYNISKAGSSSLNSDELLEFRSNATSKINEAINI
ncbi:hypothetical protein ACFLTE_04635 [Bacteroidota bacterium]